MLLGVCLDTACFDFRIIGSYSLGPEQIRVKGIKVCTSIADCCCNDMRSPVAHLVSKYYICFLQKYAI